MHERIKNHSTIEVFRSMEKSQWLSADQMAQLQIERLREFLCLIGQQVPYYRELFSSLNFDPGTVSSVQDLCKLPLLGKPEIRTNTESLKAEGVSDLQKFNTGGSSGEPLVFYLGKERVSHDVAAKRRATRWWDVDIGDSEIVVWGSPIELGSQDRVRLLRDKFFRTELLSAFEMSNTNLRVFIQRIQKIKPQMLFGYPSSLALIAEYAQKNDLQLNNLGVKVVFVTSECLYDHQRKSIETVFGCPVANGYGGRDAGFIAHQCPDGKMHITSEDIVVEIIDEDGQTLPAGHMGEIVVTHMATSEFPFVRYRTGDVGVLDADACPCGRALPVLKEIQGRTTDFLVAQDGTLLHGLSLIYVLREIEEIKSFKIIQDSVDEIRVLLVTDSREDVEMVNQITSIFRKRLGATVLVSIECVAEIPAEVSGKFRYVVSQVGHAFGSRQ
jgi:phenylacetate-CoA ligase